MYEIVRTEYSHGSVGGSDAGTKVRIALRSPDYFIWVGYGLHLKYRNQSVSFMDRLASDARRATLEEEITRARIIEKCGDETYHALMATFAKRGYATALVDGGGDPLPLPHHEAVLIKRAKYEEVSPTFDIRAEVGQKHCLQCGDALKLVTSHHRVAWLVEPDKATRTIDQCQRLSNHRVVALHGVSSNHDEKYWPNIEYFETWDGESYQQETFCSEKCAANYGWRAAAELPHLTVGGHRPAPKPYIPREDVDHDPKPPQVITIGDKIYKI